MSVSLFPQTIQTLVDLLRHRADQRPEQLAYRFLTDGESREESCTYSELDREARRIAARLSAAGLRGERALLLFPPGLPYISAFMGCLYAGVTAVPAYPPRSPRGLPRLQAILSDAGIDVALTTAALLSMARPLLEQTDDIQGLTLLATDEPEAAAELDWRGPQLGSESLAFLQYTSGSTRSARGVMLTHGHLLHNLGVMHEWFRDTSDNLAVSWLPPYHDMGLIGSILEPLYGGFPAVLMSPLHFVERPHRWLKAISRYRATASAAPNSAYEMCARRVTPEQLAELDLSSWRVAVNGAEPVRAETLDRFAGVFAERGFRPETLRPCYGLAEATLLVSGDPAGSAIERAAVTRAELHANRAVEPGAGSDAQVLVACGRALGGQRLTIVDAASSVPLPAREVGEIWLSGPSVALGYWGRPEETEAVFRARLSGDPSTPYLRTGDLGFQDHAGRLFVTGRLKDLIIIGGRNHYPQDIELAMEGSHPGLRPGCAAAFAIPEDGDGQERLVVVQEVESGAGVDAEAVAGACREALMEECDVELHGLVLIRPRTIPKTSSGKIQRFACREAFLAGTLQIVDEWRRPEPSRNETGRFEAPRNPVEELLAGLWADLLGPGPVSIHDNFFESGGESLLANQLVTRIQAALPVQVSLRDVFEAPTVAGLAALLAGRPLTEDRQRLVELLADADGERMSEGEVKS
jgi:acyl-CoA synthetase (AMP-forming)/AMP-acid ligase II